ncbi:MAG: two-component regulator propeller domain-containing protein, partial [Saprospiraceae bacterium]
MKHAQRAILIIANLLLAFLGLFAQPANISLIHYTTEQGLSHDEVNCIWKDREGFMWFGTASGLNRFDGRDFKIYLHQPDNVNSLPNNHIIGITEDSSGMLWVATHGGLTRFDKRKQTFQALDLPEQHDSILSNEWTSRLVFDQEGYGWFTSYGHLQRLNLQTLQVDRIPAPVHSTNPGYVFIDRKGRIWVQIQTALYQFDPRKQVLNYVFGNVKGVRPGVDVGKLHEEADGTLWCGSWNLGLYRYNEAQQVFEDFPDGARISVQVFSDQDENGNRFFWTSGGLDGLFLYYPAEGLEFRLSPNPREPYSHNGFLVKDFYKDPVTNILWIATEYGGVEKYDPNASKFRRGLLPIERGFSQFSFVSCVP